MTSSLKYFLYGGITFSIIWIIIFFKATNLLDNYINIPFSNRHKLSPRGNQQVSGNNPRSDASIMYDDTSEMIAINVAKGKDQTSDLRSLSIVRDGVDEARKIEGYRQHAFNQFISDRLSLFRPVPDTRSDKCRTVNYPVNLPTASVVICFFNEAWSVLLRTVYSVVNRTPPHLLHEIILIDDYSHSSFDDLKVALDGYIYKHFRKVKVYHMEQRMGLMSARNFGARRAKGEVVIFLDSHCEVNVDWLPPLLTRIALDRRTVTIPVIDIIQEDTLQYTRSPVVRGGFTWSLRFRWDDLPTNLSHTPHTSPLVTPTMAGGLFAINRDYFFAMGGYDDGMTVWGGENLEMSFRTEILPLAQDLYLKSDPMARRVDYGDVSARQALRGRLKCRSFDWYLHNVYPQQDVKGNSIPMNPHRTKVKVLRKTSIKHLDTGLCMESVKEVHDKKSLLHLTPCTHGNKKQLWHVTGAEELKLAGLLCLDYNGNNRQAVAPTLEKCHGSQQSQQWLVQMDGPFQLYNPASGKCSSVSPVADTTFIAMVYCSKSPSLLFQFYDS